MDKSKLLRIFVAYSCMFGCGALTCHECKSYLKDRLTDDGCYDGASNDKLATSHQVSCPTKHETLDNPGFDVNYCWKLVVGNEVNRGCGAVGVPPGCDNGEGCISYDAGGTAGRACCCKKDNCNSSSVTAYSLLLILATLLVHKLVR